MIPTRKSFQLMTLLKVMKFYQNQKKNWIILMVVRFNKKLKIEWRNPYGKNGSFWADMVKIIKDLEICNTKIKYSLYFSFWLCSNT